MLHLQVCSFVFFVLVVGLVISTNDICDKEVEPGSESAKLSMLEKKCKLIKGLTDNIKDKFAPKSKKPKTSCFSDTLNQLKDSGVDLRLIAPGTKWCGDGDRAKNDNDFGKFEHVDKCCQAHDKCDSNIAGGDTLGNLNNIGIFTRSACHCDNAFFHCLRNVSDSFGSKLLAKGIGETYFNVLKQQCFQCKCPETCNDDDTKCQNSCKRYEWVSSERF